MRLNKPFVLLVAALAIVSSVALSGATFAEDAAMYGGTPSRNMISDEKGMPTEWDLKTGKNVLWRHIVGSQSYAGPVVSGGQVYVGTNNEGELDPEVKGDKGVLMAFSEKEGKFLWQIVHDKLPDGRIHDWPLQGICSTPYVEGDKVYYISNRAEIVMADTQGFRDKENDGPEMAEERKKSEKDGDLIWKLDMMEELDVFPHNLAAGSPLVAEGLLFTVTGNGVDEGHVNIPSPFAPSFMAVDAKTGKLVWENADPGEKILHGSWSNPAYGVIKGKGQVVFPGGDGWVYSFEPKTGKLIWKFDANPKDSVWRLGGAGTRNNIISTPVIYKDRVYVAVGQDPEHGEGEGNFWVLDATKTGDITGKGVIWHRGGDDYHRTISTVAIKDGLLYAADLSGFLYCLDAETGAHHWTYDTFAAVWGSPFVVDGKVYIGDEDGDVAILEHGKKMKLLGEINMGSAIYTTPVAHDGVMFILTRKELFALKTGAMLKAPEPEKKKEAAKKKAVASR